MHVSKITIGRLFNLGNYEHVRYEVTVEVPAGESATQAATAVEAILENLKPLKTQCIETEAEIARARRQLEEMRTMPAVEWERRLGHHSGTPSEIIQRHEQDLAERITKREAAMSRAAMARKLLDDLGGAAQWKDAKPDWQDDADFEG